MSDPDQDQKRRLWSAINDERLRGLWARDMPVDEIAARLGRPPGSVRTRASRLRLIRDNAPPGVRQQILDLHRQGALSSRIALKVSLDPVSVGAILRRAGLSPNVVSDPTKRHIRPAAPPKTFGVVIRTGRRWIADEDALLRQLVDAGLPDAVIAGRLGREPDSVARRKSDLKIGRRGRADALPDETVARIADMRRRGLTAGVIARLTKLPVTRIASVTTTLRRQGVL